MSFESNRPLVEEFKPSLAAKNRAHRAMDQGCDAVVVQLPGTMVRSQLKRRHQFAVYFQPELFSRMGTKRQIEEFLRMAFHSKQTAFDIQVYEAGCNTEHAMGIYPHAVVSFEADTTRYWVKQKVAHYLQTHFFPS